MLVVFGRWRFKLFWIVSVARLFSFVFGGAWLREAAWIQVVLVLSIVFVCSGLFSIVFIVLRLIYILLPSF